MLFSMLPLAADAMPYALMPPLRHAADATLSLRRHARCAMRFYAMPLLLPPCFLFEARRALFAAFFATLLDTLFYATMAMLAIIPYCMLHREDACRCR